MFSSAAVWSYVSTSKQKNISYSKQYSSTAVPKKLLGSWWVLEATGVSYAGVPLKSWPSSAGFPL